MQELTETIVHLSDAQASTPVLVTPQFLQLRTPFFVELVRCLRQHDDQERAIRIDWLTGACGVSGAITLAADRVRVRRLNRALARCDAASRAVLTSALARPGGIRRTLVVGVCSQAMELPSWSTSIMLSTTPTVDLVAA